MKKILILLAMLVASFAVYAADTQVSGYTNQTRIGTFYVSTDGTSSTLTVDKLVTTGTASLPISTPYTTNTLTGDGKTNVFIWSTMGSVKVLKSITTTP